MILLLAFATAAFAFPMMGGNTNPMMNYILMDKLGNGNNALKYSFMMQSTMMAENNQNQANQMSQLLPFFLMNKGGDSGNDRSHLLMMMLMTQPEMLNNPASLLPLIALDDGDNDLQSLFLVLSMMNNQCSDPGQIQNLILMILMDRRNDDTTMAVFSTTAATTTTTSTATITTTTTTTIAASTSAASTKSMAKLKSILLIQIMSGQELISLDQLLPILLIDTEYSVNDRYLLMTLINVMSGAAKSSFEFNNNFNMLMPLLMKKCHGDVHCEKNKKDIGVIMMAMQSMAPGSSVSSHQMVPLMMMDDKSKNKDLILFNDISKLQNEVNC